MRTVLPPIAALTAVCISIPAAGVSVANAASTDDAKGPASHSVAAPQIALAAATSDLKLVLANVGSDPGLGAAAANAGQKFEILALPKNLANNVVATNGTTSGLSSTVVDAGRQAAANLLAEANQVSLAADTPTNNVVQRALQGAWDIALWINASGQTAALPVGFDPTTYVSFLKVVSNFVQLGILPLTVANLLVQGQWSKIQPTITSTTNTAFTSLTQGLPTSIAETLNWVLTGQTPAATMALNATTVNTSGAIPQSAAPQATTAAAAADTPTNNVVQRALQGAWDIALWINASGQTAALPVGFDPTTYVSFLKVVSNFVQVGVLPLTVANLLVQGQWSKIQPTVTSTTNTAFTSLTQGLPTSIAQTVNWVLTGQTPAPTMALNATTVNSTSVFQGLPTSVFQGLPTSVFQGLPPPSRRPSTGFSPARRPQTWGSRRQRTRS